jgi:hypothetical protein
MTDPYQPLDRRKIQLSVSIWSFTDKIIDVSVMRRFWDYPHFSPNIPQIIQDQDIDVHSHHTFLSDRNFWAFPKIMRERTCAELDNG